MSPLLIFVGLAWALLAVGGVWWLRRTQLQSLSRGRLAEFGAEEAPAPPERAARLSPALRRHRWVALVAALLVGSLLQFVVGLPWMYSLALAVLAGLLAWQLEAMWALRQRRRIEQQLADAVDMLIAAVKAGATLPGAMESSLQHLRSPLYDEFDLMVGRIRLGDNPLEVFFDLTERVPLETFRLFAQTLAVNWSIGGRLAQTLPSIGWASRDRIELGRRMQAMTTQARLPVLSVVAVTYFLAALMWRNDPARMGDFLTSTVGSGLVVFAILMQGVGVVWISRLSQIRF